MKQYAWMVILTALTGVSASENPFDLHENFQKIQQEQNDLLSALKQEVSKDKRKEEKAYTVQDKREDKEQEKDSPSPTQAVPKQIVEAQPSSRVVAQEGNASRQPQPIPAPIETVKSTHVKKTASVSSKIVEKKVHEEKEALKKITVAREEVQKKREQAAVLERPKRIDKAKILVATKNTEVSGVDINITKEEIEAAKRAEAALQKAIQEVDQID